jgi:hypothetical protein
MVVRTFEWMIVKKVDKRDEKLVGMKIDSLVAWMAASLVD